MRVPRTIDRTSARPSHRHARAAYSCRRPQLDEGWHGPRRFAGHRTGRPRPARRSPGRPRISRHRADGSKRRDRLRRARSPPTIFLRAAPTCRSRAATASSGATTRPASATPSGPHSWKRELLPAELPLWRAERGRTASSRRARRTRPPPLAFIGVRRCELHAIPIQDRVLVEGAHPDDDYRRGAADAFIVAVNCGQAGGTCFCVSMETGPKVGRLRPRADRNARRRRPPLPGRGRQRARRARLPPAARRDPPSRATTSAAARAVERTATQMGRTLDTDGAEELLHRNLDHPRWDDVAERCLACGNCTMVCPTCFCTTVEDVTDLAGGEAERQRHWDSCFTIDFSYIHGGSVRALGALALPAVDDPQARDLDRPVRHSGCVGCGRCITWCPVGIDITEEAAAIRATRRSRARRRAMTVLRVEALAAHVPLLRGPRRHTLALVAGCARARSLRRRRALHTRATPADEFFVDPPGRVALELVRRPAAIVSRPRRRRGLSAGPGCSPRTAGASTCARVEPVRVLAFDAACLRGKMRARPRARLRADAALRRRLVERLQATRLRLLDVYGNPAG